MNSSLTVSQYVHFFCFLPKGHFNNNWQKARKVLQFNSFIEIRAYSVENKYPQKYEKEVKHHFSASLLHLKDKKIIHISLKSPRKDNKKKQFNQPSTNSRLKRCLIMLTFFTYLYHIAMALMCIFPPFSLHQKI